MSPPQILRCAQDDRPLKLRNRMVGRIRLANQAAWGYHGGSRQWILRRPRLLAVLARHRAPISRFTDETCPNSPRQN